MRSVGEVIQIKPKVCLKPRAEVPEHGNGEAPVAAESPLAVLGVEPGALDIKPVARNDVNGSQQVLKRHFVGEQIPVP